VVRKQGDLGGSKTAIKHDDDANVFKKVRVERNPRRGAAPSSLLQACVCSPVYHRTFGKRRRFHRSPAGTRIFLLSRRVRNGSGTFF